MKKLLIILFSISFSVHGATIILDISNIEKDKKEHSIAIAIFSSKKGFPKKEQNAFFKTFTAIKDLPLKLEMPKGEYAIAIFHDQNNNKKLDTNFFGIPKEPFGFSNNNRLFMGPPSFKKAKVVVPEKDSMVKMSIKLKRFL